MEVKDNIPMKVYVSGTTVYKSVANYFKHDPEFKKLIETKFEKYLTEDNINSMLSKNIETQLKEVTSRYGWRMENEIKNEVKKKVIAEVKKQITQEVWKSSFKQFLKEKES